MDNDNTLPVGTHVLVSSESGVRIKTIAGIRYDSGRALIYDFVGSHWAYAENVYTRGEMLALIANMPVDGGAE